MLIGEEEETRFYFSKPCGVAVRDVEYSEVLVNTPTITLPFWQLERLVRLWPFFCLGTCFMWLGVWLYVLVTAPSLSMDFALRTMTYLPCVAKIMVLEIGRGAKWYVLGQVDSAMDLGARSPTSTFTLGSWLRTHQQPLSTSLALPMEPTLEFCIVQFFSFFAIYVLIVAAVYLRWW